MPQVTFKCLSRMCRKGGKREQSEVAIPTKALLAEEHRILIEELRSAPEDQFDIEVLGSAAVVEALRAEAYDLLLITAETLAEEDVAEDSLDEFARMPPWIILTSDPRAPGTALESLIVGELPRIVLRQPGCNPSSMPLAGAPEGIEGQEEFRGVVEEVIAAVEGEGRRVESKELEALLRYQNQLQDRGNSRKTSSAHSGHVRSARQRLSDEFEQVGDMERLC